MRFQRNRPGSVAEWLDIATKGLAPDAKAKVSAEIRAHYDEAVEEYLNTEMPSAQAHAEALQGLGDPRAARRRLRRVHLTEGEKRHLLYVENSGTVAPSRAVLGVSGFLMLAFFSEPKLYYFWASVLILYAYCLTPPLLRWERFSQAHMLLLVHLVFIVAFCASFGLAIASELSEWPIANTLLAVVPLLLLERLRYYFQLRGKLRPRVV